MSNKNIYKKLMEVQTELKAPKSRQYSIINCTECNKEIRVRNDCLNNHKGKCMSCAKKGSTGPVKHNKSNTRLYRIWTGLRYRRYKYEVEVCTEWKDSFDNFYKWAINNGYKDNLTIDRIDTKKGYSPDNCQWITLQENSGKDKRLFTEEEKAELYKERKLSGMTQREFCKYKGISRTTLQRIEKQMKGEM